MEKDSIYVFDKITRLGINYGEIQADFNMSLVIDGTKDSQKIIVRSFSNAEIEPQTIVYHKKTNTWWVVAHDKINRYQNDRNTFVYEHDIDLQGAIELFNARDLTDCGFNDNTYSVSDFIFRLVKLSNFEYDISVSILGPNNNFLDQKVDFIKCYENYSPLSALREFLDAFNMCAKLRFFAQYNSSDDTYTLDNDCEINIIPKTGNASRTHQMSEFTDVRETRTMDKNSFGTCVVSNAENVISSKAKIYPATGGVKIGGTEYNLHPYNAVIRLPSNVYKGNWLKMVYSKAPLGYRVADNLGIYTDFNFKKLNVLDKKSVDYELERFINYVKSVMELYLDHNAAVAFEDDFRANYDSIVENITLMSTITLYNGNDIDPVTADIVKGQDVPYITKVIFASKTNSPTKDLIFTDKETRDCLDNKYQGIYWERGKDVINGFNAFEADEGHGTEIRIPPEQTDLYKIKGSNNVYEFSYNDWEVSLSFDNTVSGSTLHLYGEHDYAYPQFIVSYIPMSDIKVKVDNQRNKRDVQLYNQNGKLTDSRAFSKLINSYSKEISSDTITRYATYYSYSSVPHCGDIVIDGAKRYVINNMSMNFSQNENTADTFGYRIECEITMSLNVAVKSLMVNPNTNIRDYGIPQNYNVKRKQLYRDYYELSYTAFTDADEEYYLDPLIPFGFTETTSTIADFVAVMKLTYAEQVESSYNWYYQLETTRYDLDKMFYVVLDFKDNNIIGYGSQNVYSGFVIDRIFSGQIDIMNTPISYVDTKGRVKDFDILFLDNIELTTIYKSYEDEHTNEAHYSDFDNGGGTLYNYSVFIPHDIYDKALLNHTMRITEQNYKKDALEVPVFEYACQIDDSDDVLIGDNILSQNDNSIYMYSYVRGTNLTQNNSKTNDSIVTGGTLLNPTFTIDNAAFIRMLQSDKKTLIVSIYEDAQKTLASDTEYRVPQRIASNYDYAFFRHSYNPQNGKRKVELMFIAKNVPPHALSVSNSLLYLKVNHYKLN